MVVFLFFSPISWDENLTLLNIKRATFADLLNYRVFNLANNHLYISLWARLLYSADILSLPLFRLPSLLSFLVYIVYLYRLLRLYSPKTVHHLYSIVLLLLPFIFYFSLARGYALGMAFMTAALYYYKLCVAEHPSSKTRPLLLFTLTGIAGSLSVFSFFYAFIAMGVLLFLKRVIITRSKLPAPEKIMMLLSTVVVAVSSAYIYKCGKIISASDPDIIGTHTLLKGGALSSILTYLSLENNVFSGTYLQAVKLIIALTFAIAVINMILKSAITDEIWIALTIIGLLIISHYATGSMYPITRALMFLIFLLYLNMVYAVSKYNSIFLKAHLIVMALMGVIFLGFTVKGMF